MTRAVAFWAGWATGGLVVWFVTPETDIMAWAPAGVYALIDYFRTERP